jgi:predicted transcriptional regulator
MSPERKGSTSAPLPKLTRRERQIVDVLYQLDGATVAEVVERLADPPSYSAVRATLNVLEEKGHVVHRQDGPRYVYLPAVPAEKARGAAISHLVQTFFGGSAERAVAALLEMSDTGLSNTDLERLAERIRLANREGR